MGFAPKHLAHVHRVAVLCYLVNTFELHMLVFDTDLFVACLKESRQFSEEGDYISGTESQRIKTYSSICR